MQEINGTTTIFVKEGTQLPSALSLESDQFLADWRVVKNIDRYSLARTIEAANWNFFYLAGELRATVLGRDGWEALRRAVNCILAKQKLQKFAFNALEVTKVVSKRFLGIPFLTVTAHSRQIQQAMGLVTTKDLVARIPVATTPQSGVGSGAEQNRRELAAKQDVALISSS